MAYDVNHFIGGKMVEGKSGRFGDIYNPSIGEVQGRVALASKAEVEAAIATAEGMFPEWSSTSVVTRGRIIQKFLQLLYANIDELAELVSREHGKVITDAKGSVQRGIEVVEFACGIPHLLKGEYSDNVSTGVDIYSMRKALGVCAGITPFNFPAMIPMWMAPMAIACGNTFVMKPSEKDPSCPMRIAEIFKEAGLPDGVLNVVNGDKEAVDTLLTDPRVKAVSFVGSTPIARYVYATATAHGKRCQAMGGAKNHMIIMPDADLDLVTDALMGAAYGSAGERCMAISVGVTTDDRVADKLVNMLKPRVETLKVGYSLDPASEMGPLVTREHWNKVKGYIDLGEQEGAEVVVDGRDLKLQGYENGFFMGGTLFDKVNTESRAYKEEIFGPTLQIVRAKSADEAFRLPTIHEYGNGTSIFTQNGHAARSYADKVEVGMVGINIPIPVPLAFHTFGGWKNSAFGDHNTMGMQAVHFYTKIKTVTTRWPTQRTGAEFDLPTLK
ncbi:CoA-acylating methylmalonate-semialdehyde dehydrogenase [Govanella unica]|uniref:methylmalonate-semialdehyde dehydrogenase (CoA acylating) n=1 Tax=Govanella unica TaxID=2975056 RepID=A0A9X3TY05_9PROT|nr:CoA-acylating methylmalonate-semialdehyde dehydrogenase [Govania unica]MDA5194076.1 CoA-acylating methylmalonate-semialdehyde dehydrogenase [Govania unica]